VTFEVLQARRSLGAARIGRRRGVTYALSALAHAGLVCAGLAYSFWHVEELAPPHMHVMLFSSATPVSPPPPPAAGGSAAAAPAPAPRKAASKPKAAPLVQPKAPALAQPPDPAPERQQKPRQDEPRPESGGGEKRPGDGVKSGVSGEATGGLAGGKPGGALASAMAAPTAKFLPPILGALHREGGADPLFPPSLRRAGMIYIVMANICASRAGGVESVALVKRADPLLDDNVVSAVKRWRYRPLMANNTPIPFCYPARFEFRSQ
jgi:outer membrane biosynthesis protein TonB